MGRRTQGHREEVLREVPLDRIVPNPRQPRSQFEPGRIEELAQSIREVGILQPPVVRDVGNGRFELVAGERRVRAARLAGLRAVTVLVRVASNLASLELALIENIQRADISPVECARAYSRLAVEFGMTQEQIARRVGKSRAAVANTMRLLHLPPRVLEGLAAGRIEEGHARAILSLNSVPRQLAAYDLTVSKGLTVREVERLSKGGRGRTGRTAEPTSGSVEALREALAERLGAPVQVLTGQQGGKLEIAFYDDEDLARIVQALGIDLS